MVGRAARGAFASALVFPGGAIDPDDGAEDWRDAVADFDAWSADDRALRIAAAREVWEETGVLIGQRRAPARGGQSFRDALDSAGLSIRLDALTPFGHWVTPEVEPRRFDTHFFLTAAPAGQDAAPDGVETLGAEWLPPSRAVELAQSGARPIIFPTMVNLARLAESGSSAEAIAAARERPLVTVQPEIVVEADGGRRVTIPVEAGYPVCEWSEPR